MICAIDEIWVYNKNRTICGCSGMIKNPKSYTSWRHSPLIVSEVNGNPWSNIQKMVKLYQEGIK